MSSHAIYRTKKEDDGRMKLKGCIVVHGNREAESDPVRWDFTAAVMAVIRMLLSIGTYLRYTFAAADFKRYFHTKWTDHEGSMRASTEGM